MSCAIPLANRLGARYGYGIIFLDDREMPIGTVLYEGESALHRSSAMIVVLLPRHFNSSYMGTKYDFSANFPFCLGSPSLVFLMSFTIHDSRSSLRRIWKQTKGSVTGCVSGRNYWKDWGISFWYLDQSNSYNCLASTSIVFAGLAAVAWYQRGGGDPKALEVRLEMGLGRLMLCPAERPADYSSLECYERCLRCI